jgi:hypothetical protein
LPARAGFLALAAAAAGFFFVAAARRFGLARAGFSSSGCNPYIRAAAIASETVGDSPGNGMGFTLGTGSAVAALCGELGILWAIATSFGYR